MAQDGGRQQNRAPQWPTLLHRVPRVPPCTPVRARERGRGSERERETYTREKGAPRTVRAAMGTVDSTVYQHRYT